MIVVSCRNVSERWRNTSFVFFILNLLVWINCDTALTSSSNKIIFITATEYILRINTILLSYAFNATNDLRIIWDDMSIVKVILRIFRLFQFNAIHCSFAKHSSLLSNASFVCSIQIFHQWQDFISFWTNDAEKSIYKNILNSRKKKITMNFRD